METKSQRASEKVIDYIIEELASGNLRPGDKLPNEAEATELLDISRVPLREALGALSLMGIVETRQGSGTYIKEYDPSKYASTMYLYSLLSGVNMKDVFEMRAIIEAEAAYLAAKRANDEDIINLRLSLSNRDLEHDENAVETFYSFNSFHKELAVASHNSFLRQFADSIRLLARDFHLKGTVDNPQIAQQLQKSQNDHHTMFRLIAAGDADGARQLMYKHIMYEFDCITEAINNQAV